MFTTPSGPGGAADEAAREEARSDAEDGFDAADDSPLPVADSTEVRATVAWWFVFLGPAALTGVLAVAGATVGPGSAVWVFPLGVWAFALTLGLAATPRRRSSWWLIPLVGAFVSAAVALGLLMALDAAGDKMRLGS